MTPCRSALAPPTRASTLRTGTRPRQTDCQSSPHPSQSVSTRLSAPMSAERTSPTSFPSSRSTASSLRIGSRHLGAASSPTSTSWGTSISTTFRSSSMSIPSFGSFVGADRNSDHAWGSPYGRVLGVGLVNEILARLADSPVLLGSGTNSSMDTNSATFPLKHSTRTSRMTTTLQAYCLLPD